MSKSFALQLVLVLNASSSVTALPVNAGARTIVVPDDYPTIASAVAVVACAGRSSILGEENVKRVG